MLSKGIVIIRYPFLSATLSQDLFHGYVILFYSRSRRAFLLHEFQFWLCDARHRTIPNMPHSGRMEDEMLTSGQPDSIEDEGDWITDDGKLIRRHLPSVPS